ncbi:PHD finger protein 20-like protein 1 [Lachnellula arida]|uniref:PHD finger protein 20-like protein 1 n=1 Tax=Lachnellula arida TaxID=1316785 RepID=A0A8T9AZY0_9HELO|nr:PHD finger protein 20-like protein 1 [Lachnellula arida]
MSWDQPAFSFGNPNAQPPTPTQTPTSAQFPSPTFQTPRNNNSSFEDRNGWTPQFAEEYSVFHSTPGRLTSSQHPSFVDVDIGTPLTATGQRRPLSSAGDINTEIATHVHHLSPNPNVPLAPVDSSNQLPSSPGLYPPSTTRNRFDDSTKKKVTPRRPRKRLEEAFSGQTATPPATASKGSRKLAPKLQTNTMQNDSQEGHYGSSQTPTHQSNGMPFPSTSAEFFYPMSAPATAPVFTNTKPFWDQDTSMGGMDMDFTADDGGMFNTSSHKVSTSFDWGRSNQMFQDTVNMQPSQRLPQQKVTSTTSTGKRQRPLAPKISVPEQQQQQPLTSLPPFEFTTSHASEDPFSAVTLDGAVDPVLLFSRHNSVSMPSEFEDVSLPPARPVTSHVPLEPYSHQLREASRDREELLLSRTSRDMRQGRRYERGTMSSPVKGSARPALQRSVSDTRGKRVQDRVRPRTGRSSPVKQQRPPILTSIPELPTPRARTEVKFTIDAKGRARTETVMIQEEPRTTPGGPSTKSEEFYSSLDDSSSDDEPILIPSRNTSFTAPPPSKGPKLARFETSNRTLNARRHSSSGYSQSESSSQQSLHHDESEAETVMDDDEGLGDATRELRKVMEDRKKIQMTKIRNPQHHRYSSNNPRRSSQYASFGSSTNISPTTITDPDGATPSSSRSGATRCVCNNPDSEGFMIQCESCDNWLHAECVGIDRRSLPPVYVCAFCANTPNMRGGRIRDSARGTTHIGSSPLARKSFKSFR